MEGVVLKVNHRKILAGIAGLLGAEEHLVDFTIALDKIDKIGASGVFEELKSKGFSDESLQILEQLVSLKGSTEEQFEALKRLFSDQSKGLEGLSELEFIFSQLKANSLKTVALKFDLTLARGLHYYTGMIVEVAAPEQVKMGSIGGGGRYDDLTGTFGLKNMSGIGVSFGFERIYLVMDALGLFPEALQPQTKVLFTNFGAAAAEQAYRFLSLLRKQGVSCELYPTEAKLKKQLAYANAKNINRVVLIGSEELKQNCFVLKDMSKGTQETYPVKELVERLA